MRDPKFKEQIMYVIFQCAARLNPRGLRLCGNKSFSMPFLLLKMFSKTFCLSVKEWQRCLKLTLSQTKRKKDLIFSQELSLINSFHKINLRESHEQSSAIFRATVSFVWHEKSKQKEEKVKWKIRQMHNIVTKKQSKRCYQPPLIWSERLNLKENKKRKFFWKS